MSHAIRRALSKVFAGSQELAAGSDGQAILEAAIMLPVFILVSFIFIDIQWMTRSAAAIEYVVNESARCEAIQSGACPNTSQTRAYATTLAANLRLTNGDLDITAPNCTPNVCTVSLSYRYKPLGVWFPNMTISRTGTASVPPPPPGPGQGGQ